MSAADFKRASTTASSFTALRWCSSLTDDDDGEQGALFGAGGEPSKDWRSGSGGTDGGIGRSRRGAAAGCRESHSLSCIVFVLCCCQREAGAEEELLGG